MTVDILTMHMLRSCLRKELDIFLPPDVEFVLEAVENVLASPVFYCCVHKGLEEDNDGKCTNF